ncbi:PBP1A family penicillin-binding protein [Aquibacillus koreensis]|uniref:PBP1A family penicillin-binding protein n=1 Tax=Aquibacillus koreensis TaxID=279446 RepID=A0A9X3WHK0_9BACI|nr:PBP1A family penicillin-binding protein [Aquibacillus koreensis]MCT2537135.1 PBP1A family penicillin-binding protein [Aquibacillus koreensis]MDC3419882.1 PBP1A family penicillin-binding protein [Aquibacillus koreensis]
MRKNKTLKVKRLLLKAFFVFITIFFITVLVGGLYVHELVEGAPKIDDEDFHYSNSSTLYDHDDKPMFTLDNGVDRQSTSIEKVPQLVEDAFIAIEDVRFYEHSGLDFKRIGAAVISNITDGFGSEGGSTITQQVVKNSLLTSDKTMERKVQEAYLALQLEEEYSKDEILELYLNKIYFGNGAYGIVIAADTYFGKDLKALTIEEAALLAGLPQRPTDYDPYQNPELAKERRNTVLFVMNEHGFITDKEYNQAKSVPITDMLQDQSNPYDISDAYMDQVYKELENMEEIDTSMIYNGGLEIYTTYDKSAQQHVEKVLNTDEFITYPDDRFQVGLTMIDNLTGGIKAIGGGRNQESGKSRINYATNIERSPGSTIKPILSYGPSIEYLEWSTYKQIEDEEITYTDTDKVINNYDDRYHGIVSMREALKRSWNVPAVKTFKKVGSERAGEFASKLGLSFDGPIYESFALGAFEEGISPLELAGAYAAFGNEGVYNKPHAIRKVVFPNGKEINMKPEPVAAMREYTSYMITDMLQTVVEEGTGSNANIEGMEVAGKTGTTNFNEETIQKYNITEAGVPDSWFTGYTTDYTISVWTGYPQVSEENYIKTREDKQIAEIIFRDVMAKTVDENTKDFEKPDSVEKITFNTRTGEKKTESSRKSNIRTELFVSGTSLDDVHSLVEDGFEQEQSYYYYQDSNSNDKQDEKNDSTEQENQEESREEKQEDKEETKEEEEEAIDSDQPEGEEEETIDSDQPEGEEEETIDSDQPEGEEEETIDSDQPEGEEEEAIDSDQPEGEEEEASDSDQPEGEEEEAIDSDQPEGEEGEPTDSEQSEGVGEESTDPEQSEGGEEEITDSDQSESVEEESTGSEQSESVEEESIDSNQPEVE